MAVYEYGATVTLTHSAGSGADVAVLVTAPNGTESSPATSYNAGTGLWSASVTADQYDDWLYSWVVDGVAVEQGAFTVGGPWYSTVALLKKTVNKGASDTTVDDLLAPALEAASRSVEQWCDSRRTGGFTLDDTATARLYRPAYRGPAVPGTVYCTDDGYRLYVHEFGTLSGLIVETSIDNVTWTTLTINTDFETWPDNALADDRPVEALLSTTEWPTRVRVTARWGWPTVPQAVKQATLLQASRLYRRKDSPEGVAGSSEWGLVRVPNLDPDVKALLSYLRTEALIG